eukprot:scaffold7027_cov106-Isochrysis_galbana.AAC.3
MFVAAAVKSQTNARIFVFAAWPAAPLGLEAPPPALFSVACGGNNREPPGWRPGPPPGRSSPYPTARASSPRRHHCPDSVRCTDGRGGSPTSDRAAPPAARPARGGTAGRRRRTACATATAPRPPPHPAWTGSHNGCAGRLKTRSKSGAGGGGGGGGGEGVGSASGRDSWPNPTTPLPECAPESQTPSLSSHVLAAPNQALPPPPLSAASPAPPTCDGCVWIHPSVMSSCASQYSQIWSSFVVTHVSDVPSCAGTSNRAEQNAARLDVAGRVGARHVQEGARDRVGDAERAELAGGQRGHHGGRPAARQGSRPGR